MIVNPITDGIVLDHIKAGRAMEIYNVLNLGRLDCTVAIILNADSQKMGKKDILKICQPIDLNLDVLGYLDPGITVTYIADGKKVKQVHLELPDRVSGVIACKNPRCITSTEQELPHVFKLTDREKGIYRCVYCETKAK
ncbi:MAG TPA: aspartate carbamoyltransferase regulatory subunit [Oscillospiraceae bacterium]|nr:aspartate carbamoyltransferase regulatory subunit [Oscillospiraceae bacterium]HPK36576.1 aspartate carbamoyltransferase regulatory subunit [Oscillospiraceae bacterium]HPR76771.1 aspartate carbamoyltransferase regulatory subunit [Oscillospiraceae bacterium]